MPANKQKSARKIAPGHLVMTRIFRAPRRVVYAAWTDPQQLRQWSAPNGFTIPEAKGDVREGGHWSATMRSPEGEDLRLSGTYREIVPGQLLSFTHAWDEDGRPGHETVVTVRFSDLRGKTKMLFRQGPFDSVASRDGHKDGWTQCFERLASLVQARTGKAARS